MNGQQGCESWGLEGLVFHLTSRHCRLSVTTLGAAAEPGRPRRESTLPAEVQASGVPLRNRSSQLCWGTLYRRLHETETWF